VIVARFLAPPYARALLTTTAELRAHRRKRRLDGVEKL